MIGVSNLNSKTSDVVKNWPRHLRAFIRVLAVIPAKAGTQNIVEGLGPDFRRGDVNGRIFSLGLVVCFLMFEASFAFAAAAPGAKPVTGEEMEVQIKGQFKGRLLVRKIVAPVSMNLEKLQDFPEDPSQKILLDPLPLSQSADFNARSEVKGHAPFVPWIPAILEPPFLRMAPPPPAPKAPPVATWVFEVLNPQGQTIFRQRGTQELPDELVWEGKDSEKQFAVVDRLYSAQLTLVRGQDRATVVTGNSVVLPAMIYASGESQTVEFSLARLFVKDKAEISPEGVVMMLKFCERIRELGLTKMHLRIAGENAGLSAQREAVLTAALEKALALLPGAIEHDHVAEIPRGEIAVFWLKTGGSR